MDLKQGQKDQNKVGVVKKTCKYSKKQREKAEIEP